MSLQKVKKIAEHVRKAFEEIDAKNNMYGARSDLCGYCGRASIQLFLECKKRGVKIDIAEASGHMFNIYKDYIIDITATQFGIFNKVNIKKIKEYNPKPYFYDFYKIHTTATSASKSFGIWCSKKDRRIIRKFIKLLEI